MTNEQTTEQVHERVDAIYRTESRRIFATLIRLLGDFDLAEDALHDAFRVAIEQWPRDGLPANPRAWLVSTGRFKAIDTLRRRACFDASLAALAERLDRDTSKAVGQNDVDIRDDRLRLIFTCCHPARSECGRPCMMGAATPGDQCSSASTDWASPVLGSLLLTQPWASLRERRRTPIP
jgi:RNA polymerase sigma-70 factor (ECF subfamily)